MTYRICSSSWILLRFTSFSWYGEWVSKPSWQQVLTILIRWKKSDKKHTKSLHEVNNRIYESNGWCHIMLIRSPLFSGASLGFNHLNKPVILAEMRSKLQTFIFKLVVFRLKWHHLRQFILFCIDPSGAKKGFRAILSHMQWICKQFPFHWSVFLPKSVEVGEAATIQKVIGNGLC